jgi:hypothetical protein
MGCMNLLSGAVIAVWAKHPKATLATFATT